MAFLTTALTVKLQHGFGGNKLQSTYSRVGIGDGYRRVPLLKSFAKSLPITFMTVQPVWEGYQPPPDICLFRSGGVQV